MENFISVLLGGSWASGINLYMTAAGLGIAQRMHWIDLPGNLTILGHPLVILLAVVLYAAEFFADKIPFFDSVWDMIHTFIRPTGAAIGGYLATAGQEPLFQTAAAVLTGGIALSSHLTKASARAAINSAPTGVMNSVASVSEDAGVFGMLYFIVKHPFISIFVAVALIVLTVWLLFHFFRFIKRLFHPVKKEEVIPKVV